MIKLFAINTFISILIINPNTSYNQFWSIIFTIDIINTKYL